MAFSCTNKFYVPHLLNVNDDTYYFSERDSEFTDGDETPSLELRCIKISFQMKSTACLEVATWCHGPTKQLSLIRRSTE